MVRSKTESIESLLRGIEAAKQQREYNFAKDLKMLFEAYPKTSKRDYLQLLAQLIEKYESGEAAEVHAALVQKCRAGDVEAIRLYREMQKDEDAGGSEVVIVDDI